MTVNNAARPAGEHQYDPVPLVGAEAEVTAQILREQIDAWISSPPMAALIAAETGKPTGDLRERLAYLDGLSAAAWDFRAREAARKATAGQAQAIERSQVAADAVPREREEDVRAAADALGMVDPRPPRFDSYDWVLVLGGLVRGCLWRTQYAAYLVHDAVRTERVVALTAYRRLARNVENPQQDEPTLLAEAGSPSRDFEADVMEDALRDSFGIDELSVVESGAGKLDADRFKVAAGKSGRIEVILVAAPDPSSRYRADTGTTMRYWATRVAKLEPGQRVLNVTSAIYVPFQHAVAVENLTLQYGVVVDTVGLDHSVIKPVPSPQRFTAVNYLQEVRSAIRAYRHLLGAIDDETKHR